MTRCCVISTEESVSERSGEISDLVKNSPVVRDPGRDFVTPVEMTRCCVEMTGALSKNQREAGPTGFNVGKRDGAAVGDHYLAA